MLDVKITNNPQRMAQTLDICQHRSWEKRATPFKMVDNVYCLATLFASQYIIKTNDGLVLVDSGWNEMTPFMIDSIYQLGLDPHDIKYMFLTHGHFDHIGGARVVQEISHCKTFFPPEDQFFLTERRDLIGNEKNVPAFSIDVLYDYKTVYEIGGTKFWVVPAPGHTPGTSSVFWQVKHQGKDVICAICGGSGLNTMGREALKSAGLPFSLQKAYCDSMLMQSQMHVDCYCPAHQFGYDHIELAKHDDGSGTIFIDDTVWPRIMRKNYDDFMAAYGSELEQDK